ncbi:Aste57867_20673 [Aphanomyces stellatus]|uniref:Aste57867_20673 protein n=1 Tax=Aphanomyces stellatus TaxID=120398 RepID=A0A485LFM4_9STRA|nr:hypothetical protein As57867_020605 [Aphanomyces stellatus]VFT97353.1 Aste57867_20673 [Aphanomyces stellatus]
MWVVLRRAAPASVSLALGPEWMKALPCAGAYRFSTRAPHRKVSWDTTIMALRRFKDLHGHLQVPQTFRIHDGEQINDQAWPVDTWGLNLGVLVNRLRAAIKKKTLSSEQTAQLSALGFEPVSRLTWADKLSALRIFYDLHGHMNVPIAFTISVDDDGTWPASLDGVHLGRVVNSLRTRRESLPPSQQRALDDLGFVWSSWDLSWTQRIRALSTYRLLHGDLHLIPRDFVVPADDPRWPRETHGMHLYMVVANMRKRAHRLTFAQLETLTNMDFPWDKVEFAFETRADAWHVYATSFGTKDVPASFVVPSRDERWPRHMWGLPLGRVVRSMIDKPSNLTIHQLTYLHGLGLLPQSRIGVIG